MPKVVALRDLLSPSTLIIGNGDVKSVEDGRQKAELFGADGIMLGRAIFGNPYVFAGKSPEDLSISEKLSTLAQLAEYFDDIRPAKSFHIFKKHIKAFVSGFDAASELRAQLMECENSAGIKSVITSSNLV
jgi:tRNA-dihydrouridine synthase